MPTCMFYTNLKEDQIPEDLETSLAQTVGKILNKPIEKMSVNVIPGVRMYRLQSNAPTCFLQIYSVGVFDKEKNTTYTPPLIAFLKSQLNLSEERISILYIPVEPHDLGYAK